MTDVKEIERLEKAQEKKVRLKKAHTEKAKEKGDLKSIEKAQAEEEKAIAVLEKIREDKRRVEIEDKIFEYVKLNQPTELEEIAKALNLPPESIEKHIEALGMVKDANGKVYSDRNSMSAMRLEEWKKKREVVIKRWSEIAEKNPGLTQEELKEIYIRHFPEDAIDIERYLDERRRKESVAPKGAKYCRNCNQWVTPTKGPAEAVIALFLLGGFIGFFGLIITPLLAVCFIMFLVAIIYGVVKADSGGRCPLCNSKNFGTPPNTQNR